MGVPTVTADVKVAAPDTDSDASDTRPVLRLMISGESI